MEIANFRSSQEFNKKKVFSYVKMILISYNQVKSSNIRILNVRRFSSDRTEKPLN